MHSAHSEHHYMPLATGRWCFCPASHSYRIAVLALCALEFNFVNFGVKVLMKTIYNTITLVCCCICLLCCPEMKKMTMPDCFAPEVPVYQHQHISVKQRGPAHRFQAAQMYRQARALAQHPERVQACHHQVARCCCIKVTSCQPKQVSFKSP